MPAFVAQTRMLNNDGGNKGFRCSDADLRMRRIEGPVRFHTSWWVTLLCLQEAETGQEQYVQLRREHETLVTKHKALELTSQAAVNVSRAQHAAELQELQAKIRSLSSRTPAHEKVAGLEAQLHASETANGDQSVLMRKLQQEVADLRYERRCVKLKRKSIKLN